MSSNREPESGQAVIVIEEERLKERFTQIPNTILRHPDVTPGAKLTYVMLLSYAWQEESCFPGQNTLAQDIGVSRRSVVTYLQELQEKGLLLVKRRGLGQTNVYTLTRWDTSRSAKFALPEVQKTTHQEVQDLRTNNTQEKKTHKKKTQELSSNDFDGESEIFNSAKPSRLSKAPRAQARSRRHSGVTETTTEPPAMDNSQEQGEATEREGRGFASVGHIISYRQDQQLASAETAPAQRENGPRRPKKAQESASHPQTGPTAQRRRERPPEVPEWLRRMVTDLSHELHDPSHIEQNIGQAARLWAKTGGEDQRFSSKWAQARRETLKRKIDKPSKDHPGMINKMPYFFKVLRDMLGVSEQ